MAAEGYLTDGQPDVLSRTIYLPNGSLCEAGYALPMQANFSFGLTADRIVVDGQR